MNSFYSKSTNGIYHSASYDSTAPSAGLVPSDSIIISDALFSSLLSGLQSGQIIQSDSNGNPILAAAPILPITCSPYQFRQALTQAGLRLQVEALITNAATPQNVKDAYQYATSFIENDPNILALASQLSQTTEQIHSLFQLAVTLNA